MHLADHISYNQTRRWHPKLTLYRVFVMSTSLGIGTAKVIVTLKGHDSPSITLEWISGVVVFTIIYSLGNYEHSHSANLAWLFSKDRSMFIWWIFGYTRPLYDSEEKSEELLLKSRHPRLTGYRLLNSVVVVIYGLSKSALAYKGLITAPTALEWAVGTFLTTCLYWLGLYELSTEGVFPAMFETDYTPDIIGFCASTYRVLSTLILVLLLVLFLVLSVWWTYTWTIWTQHIWNLIPSASPQFRGVAFTSSTHIALEAFFRSIYKVMWTLVCFICIELGFISCCIALWMIAMKLVDVPASVILRVRQAFRLQGHASKANIRTRGYGWTNTVFLDPIIANRTGYSRRPLTILLFPIYIALHGIIFLICLLWIVTWGYGLIVFCISLVQKANVTWMWVLKLALAILVCISALGAIGIGIIFIILVLVSVYAPFIAREQGEW